MQRAAPPPGAFSLLAYWLPIPFQCFPHGFPILRRRLHDYFFGLLLDEPRSQRSQLFRLAAKHPPLKLVFAFDFNVGHNYSQHLLVDINSRYPVGHSSSWPGAESVLRYLNQSRGLSPLPQGKTTTPNYSLKHARPGSDRWTASNFPLISSTSPLQTVAILPLSGFIKFRGPKALKGQLGEGRSPRDAIRSQ